MKFKVFIITFLIITSAVFVHAESFSSLEYHFSFTIPHGWVPIPKARIDERMRQLSTATGTNFINYIAGFRRINAEDFSYPNILLQFHDFRGLSVTWNDFVRNFSNVDLNSYISNTGYSDFINNFNSTSPLIETTNRIIIHNAESNVLGIGILRSVVILHLGKNGIVQINITIPQNEYNRYTNDIVTIVESLIFDYGYIY